MKSILITVFICSLLVTSSADAVFIGSGVMRDRLIEPCATRGNRLRISALVSLGLAGIFGTYRGVQSTTEAATSVRSANDMIVKTGVLFASMATLAGGDPVSDRFNSSHIGACALIMGEDQDHNDIIDFSKQENVAEWFNSNKGYFTSLFNNLLLKSQYKTNPDIKENNPYIDPDKNDIVYQITEDASGNLIPKKLNNSNKIIPKNKSNYLVVEKDSSIFFLNVSENLHVSICSY